MKFERLSKENNGNKKFLYGFITCAILLIIFNFFMSYAKYKSVDSVKLAEGTINYESADLNIIAMIKNDGEKDEPIEEVPTSGYIIDKDRSYCKGPDKEEIKNIINYENGKLTIDFSKKGTKCYLYFTKTSENPADDTLANLFKGFTTSNNGTNFKTDLDTGVLKVTGIDTGDNKNTLYIAEDNDGPSYFFRGQAPNNWVQFAGMRWRIIRINGDGTIRMIFQCSGANCKNTLGVETQINGSIGVAYKLNPYSDNTYLGYYYGKERASTYKETHTSLTSNPSTIAEKVNNWYDSYLIKFENYIDLNAGFCNDRQIITGVDSDYDTGTGVGNSRTSYAMWGRVIKNKNIRSEQLPTLKCGLKAATAVEQETSVEVDDTAYQRDLFTKIGANKGNKVLPHPIGLITANEVILAGGLWGTGNSNYYLYTGLNYWTMTPWYYATSNPTAFYVYTNGQLTGTWAYVTDYYYARPVINLKADTIFAPGGDGTIDNPYVVVTE